jgi:hypothetical protein
MLTLKNPSTNDSARGSNVQFKMWKMELL